MINLRAVLLSLVLLSLAGGQQDGFCQEAYEVRIRNVGQTCENGQCVQTIGEGNAVVFAASDKGVWVVTAGHNVAGATTVSLLIEGKEYPAQVGRSSTVQYDQSDDIAVVYAAGDFSNITPVAIGDGDLPEGAEVEFRGYSPVIEQGRITQWQYSRASTRVQRMGNAYRTSLNSTVQGNSGAGYYHAGKLVAIHRGKIDGYAGGCTSVRIRARLEQWGYRPLCSTPLPASNPPATVATTPQAPAAKPVIDVAYCVECDARFAAIEKRLEFAISQLSIQINAIAMAKTESPGDGEKIAAVSAEMKAIRAELDALKPLTERRVILVSDGKVTSQRTLKPSDPLVLGSEIVVRKPNAGN